MTQKNSVYLSFENKHKVNLIMCFRIIIDEKRWKMEFFIFFIILLLFQKILELLIDKMNEKWLMRKGAKQMANNHYKWFSCLHLLFLIFVILEVSWRIYSGSFWINWFFLIFYILAQLARGWCMSSLGRFWNTKIYVMRNVTILKRGPYRILQHPEYIIVFIELFVTPIMFQAYICAVVFPTLYIFIIMLRISELEKIIGYNARYKI